jgi:hypothetical protein
MLFSATANGLAAIVKLKSLHLCQFKKNNVENGISGDVSVEERYVRTDVDSNTLLNI